MKRERPWRAVASHVLAPGLPPVVVGRCYRATEEGLRRFVDEHEAAGCRVRVWKVETLPGVDEVAGAPSCTCEDPGDRYLLRTPGCPIHWPAATAPSPPVPSSS